MLCIIQILDYLVPESFTALKHYNTEVHCIEKVWKNLMIYYIFAFFMHES